ncbi:MAG: hypothetical protein FIB01_16270, partial [Gemmatimonadetes bacterium]|nr:hypothetical protein [Gemmatimonadota bacterium]
RALAITAAGSVLSWCARTLARAGLARPVLAALALAVVLAAVTSLLQAYGVRTELFSANRAPGGTLGNRNSVAHLAALGFPLILLGALAAPRFLRYLLAALGSGLVVAVLLLTRSRAGWLAFAGAMALVLAAMAISPALRRSARTWARLVGVLVLAVAAVAGAVTMPNALRWNSDNPYLESMRSVANFQEGSGRGRLVQYTRSLRMTIRHPVLGVGPGNWAVVYPDHAAPGDRSLSSSNPGMTSNPWPSSDWVAFVSERGPAAALLLALAILGIALGGLARLLTARDADAALRDVTLVALLAAATIAGLFDAVLLLPTPAFIVWTAAGALSAPLPEAPELPPGRAFLPALALVTALAGVGAVRSGAQLTAMTMHGYSSRPAWLTAAARIDPGNYRLHLQLARRSSGLGRATRCRHALAAHALYPNAVNATSLSRGCR